MSVSQQYTSKMVSYDKVATIAASGTQSDLVDIGGMSICAIIMPAAWTAATLTIEASNDNGATWHPVYDNDGTQVSLTVAASRYVLLDPSSFVGICVFRLVSSVAQAAERAIIICARPI